MPEEVFTITTAAPDRKVDQRGRQRVYLISMAVRTICFLGAVVTPSPWRWVLAFGAVALPYFAVIFANAKTAPVDGLTPVVRSQLPGRQSD